MPENPQIILTPGTLPEGACYGTEQERLNGFAEAITGALPDNYTTWNGGPDAPTADDRHKPWHRTNADGSPDGDYDYFEGSWKRRHREFPGKIIMWDGSAAAVDALDGGAAGTVTTMSGPFWEMVTALAAKFPVGVGAFASGAAVAVTGTGGEEKVVLVMNNLPSEPPPLGHKVDKMLVHRDEEGEETNADRKGLDQHDSDHVYRTNSETDHDDNALGDLGEDEGHNNLPPYYGVYFLRRTARIYYSI